MQIQSKLLYTRGLTHSDHIFLGDIIKATLGKARENNKVNSAKTIVQALIIKFNELRQIQGEKVINRNTGEFVHLKELAKR